MMLFKQMRVDGYYYLFRIINVVLNKNVKNVLKITFKNKTFQIILHSSCLLKGEGGVTFFI